MNSSAISSGNESFSFHESSEENAFNRVTNLPVIMSTWNAMHNYYASVKKNYPNVTAYLEAAENLTISAANLAINTSKPVVDRLAPTVNSYANKGLDKLEDKVPIITKQPEEIYATTKSKAADLLSNKVNSALDLTEKYVDYYLPREEYIEKEDENFNDSDVDDEDDDNVSDLSSSDDISDDEVDVDKTNPSERLRSLSNKVRQRSYKKAMKKWNGVRMRSSEALINLNFTVDLIQYAQGAFGSSGNVVTTPNEIMLEGVSATLDGLQYAADSVNEQVEKRVLVKARKLTQQLNQSCQSLLKYIQNSPRFHPLLEQAVKAKEATEELYSTFSGKTSISQFSNALIESTRPRIQFVEKTLLQILQNISEQPPISWLAPELDIDPLGGMDMDDIEMQMFGVSLLENHNGVRFLPKKDQTSPPNENKVKDE